MPFYKTLFKNTILICLLFSLFLTIGVYFSSYNYLKKEYLTSANSDIQNISNNIEYNLLQTQGLPILFSSSDVIKKYVECDYYSAINIIDVHDYLFSTISAMPNVRHNIFVTKIDDDHIISGKSSSSFYFFTDSYNVSREHVAETLNDFKKNPDINTIAFVTSKDNTHYFIVFNCDRTSFKNAYYIISVYDLDNIVSVSSDSIFALQNNNKILYCNNNELIGSVISKDFPSAYTVIAKRSVISDLLGDLTYTILIPKKRYFALINKHIYYVIPTLFLLYILSYVISKRTSNKIYKPVERLINEIGNISPSVIEDEFESITSTISLLTRQNAKYHDDIEKNQIALKNKFFQDLLAGILSKEQIEAGIKKYFSNNDAACPLVPIIASITNTAFDGDANDSYHLNALVYNLFEDALGTSHFINFTTLSPLVYCIILSENDIPALHSKLKQIALQAENTLKLDINSYIGACVDSWEDLPSSFFSAYMTYMATFTENTQLVTTSSSMPNTALYPIDLENKIFAACVGCKKKQLEQLLDFIFTKNIKSKDATPNTNSYLSTLFYSTCMRILSQLDISVNDVFGDKYNIYLELRNCRSFLEIHDKLLYIFSEIINYTTVKKESFDNEYRDNMLAFVEQNYNKDIALVNLAEYMNVSQAYVSKLFKRLTGYNFKEYLTKVRVDKGTELLLAHPNMSIKEISQLVGYNNPEPFTKAFIQMHNILPNEYRKQKFYK